MFRRVGATIINARSGLVCQIFRARSSAGKLLLSAAQASVIVAALLIIGCASKRQLVEARQKCVECALKRTPDPASLPNAAATFRELCDDGDAASCSVLGVMYEQGRAVLQDHRMAMQLYQVACNDRNARGCANLGRMYEKGITGMVDLPAASLMYELGCRLESAQGCYHLARMRYRMGDTKGARASLEAACKNGSADGCLGLGALYQHGNGVTQSAELAKTMYSAACKHGLDSGCDRLDEMRGGSHSAKTATTRSRQ